MNMADGRARAIPPVVLDEAYWYEPRPETLSGVVVRRGARWCSTLLRAAVRTIPKILGIVAPYAIWCVVLYIGYRAWSWVFHLVW